MKDKCSDRMMESTHKSGSHRHMISLLVLCEETILLHVFCGIHSCLHDVGAAALLLFVLFACHTTESVLMAREHCAEQAFACRCFAIFNETLCRRHTQF